MLGTKMIEVKDGICGKWYDANKYHPEIVDQDIEVSNYVLCYGNKGDYYLCFYMRSCDTWLKTPTQIRHVEAWTPFPPPPTLETLGRRLGQFERRTSEQRYTPQKKYVPHKKDVMPLKVMWDRLYLAGIVDKERPEDFK